MILALMLSAIANWGIFPSYCRGAKPGPRGQDRHDSRWIFWGLVRDLPGSRALPLDIEMLLGVQTPRLSCETRRALFMQIAYNSQAIVGNLLGPFSGYSRQF